MTEEKVVRGPFSNSRELGADVARELLEELLSDKRPLMLRTRMALLALLLFRGNEMSAAWQLRIMKRLLLDGKGDEDKILMKHWPREYKYLRPLVDEELRRLNDEEAKRVEFYRSQPSSRKFRDGKKRPSHS